jgi:DNA-binding transcriptional LysR family regulator
MPGPGLAEINAFIAIAEQKSFVKAASRLGVSPSTLSETLRRLEERLGVRLLERTTRSVAATEAGERLLTRLRPVLADYEAALESINDFRDKPSGHLRLTVAPPAADFVLAPMIGRFLAAYPEISVEIAVDSTLTDIVAGRFDAGIRPGERLERDMIAVRISDALKQVVVASPDYLARRGRPKTPRDLPAHNCIRIRLPSGAVFNWGFTAKGKGLEVAVEGTLIVNEIALALRATSDGAGLMQLPLDYAAPHLADGTLEAVLEDWAPPPIDGFFLYYPSRRQMRPPLKALVDFLRGAAKVDRRKGGV